MQIIPVIDIMNGIVVHGVAGKRSQYRRIQSRLTDSCDPSVLLKQFQEKFGTTTCYVADLDAIVHQQPNRCTLAELTRSETSLIVDGGVRSVADATDLIDLGVDSVVVGLETLPGPDVAEELIAEFLPQQLILSLDLRNGSVQSPHPSWSEKLPIDVASELIEIGYQSLIVLDVATVGTLEGNSTLEICMQIKNSHPNVRVITGGGVRSIEDLQELRSGGVDGALVASAIHNGQISPQDLRGL